MLEQGDILYIPAINPVVTIQGKVQSPLKIFFDKEHTNLTYYIDKAGGFGIKPWRERIYVTYANGQSKRTRNFGLFHFYPKIEEGSTINVPAKPTGINPLRDLLSSLITAAIPVATAIILSNIIK